MIQRNPPKNGQKPQSPVISREEREKWISRTTLSGLKKGSVLGLTCPCLIPFLWLQKKEEKWDSRKCGVEEDIFDSCMIIWGYLGNTCPCIFISFCFSTVFPIIPLAELRVAALTLRSLWNCQGWTSALHHVEGLTQNYDAQPCVPPHGTRTTIRIGLTFLITSSVFCFINLCASSTSDNVEFARFWQKKMAILIPLTGRNKCNQ